MNVKWENVRENEVGEVEDEWLNLKGEVKNIANHVCGVKRVGGRRRKGSEWNGMRRWKGWLRGRKRLM